MLPSLFYPSLTGILGRVRTILFWAAIAFVVYYFMKHNAHDYDQKTLVSSLSVLPLILAGLNLFFGILEVVR